MPTVPSHTEVHARNPARNRGPPLTNARCETADTQSRGWAAPITSHLFIPLVPRALHQPSLKWREQYLRKLLHMVFPKAESLEKSSGNHLKSRNPDDPGLSNTSP